MDIYRIYTDGRYSVKEEIAFIKGKENALNYLLANAYKDFSILKSINKKQEYLYKEYCSEEVWKNAIKSLEYKIHTSPRLHGGYLPAEWIFAEKIEIIE
jgi:hypothetical protein